MSSIYHADYEQRLDDLYYSEEFQKKAASKKDKRAYAQKVLNAYESQDALKASMNYHNDAFNVRANHPIRAHDFRVIESTDRMDILEGKPDIDADEKAKNLRCDRIFYAIMFVFCVSVGTGFLIWKLR